MPVLAGGIFCYPQVITLRPIRESLGISNIIAAVL